MLHEEAIVVVRLVRLELPGHLTRVVVHECLSLRDRSFQVLRILPLFLNQQRPFGGGHGPLLATTSIPIGCPFLGVNHTALHYVNAYGGRANTDHHDRDTARELEYIAGGEARGVHEVVQYVGKQGRGEGGGAKPVSQKSCVYMALQRRHPGSQKKITNKKVQGGDRRIH